MNELSKKVALITGASGGVGNFVTEAFLAAGATVIGVARSIQPSAFADPKFVAMAADLSRGERTKEMVVVAIQRFEKIDMLVHVMGGFAGGELIDDTDDATW